MANSSNKKLVPEAMTALDKFKYEVASEVVEDTKEEVAETTETVEETKEIEETTEA